MILVTLGTQKQSFKRLLEYIENSNINDKIIVQAGYTKFKSNKMDIIDFISYEEMETLIDNADIIITHAGTGAILEPLKKGKKLIVCSRLNKYKEHVDDHQQEILDIFYEQGYVEKIDDGIDLDELIAKIKYFTPTKYISNTNIFISNLKQIIDK